MELVTGVWKLYRCVEAKEDLLYRFSAAGPVDWGSNQSTGGVPGALCMNVHRDQSTAVTVQSTGNFPESFGQSTGAQTSRLAKSQEQCACSVHRSSRLLSQCSRLGFFPRV